MTARMKTPAVKVVQRIVFWGLIGIAIFVALIFTRSSGEEQSDIKVEKEVYLTITDTRVQDDNHPERYNSEDHNLRIELDDSRWFIFSHTMEVYDGGFFSKSDTFQVTYTYDKIGKKGEWRATPVRRGSAPVQKGTFTIKWEHGAWTISEWYDDGVWIKDFIFAGM